MAESMKDIFSPCTVLIRKIGGKPPVMLDTEIKGVIKEAAKELGLSAVPMPSGASHDSSPIAHVMPTGMIFVPSHEGLSHCRDEFTSNEDILNGAALLHRTILRLDKMNF